MCSITEGGYVALSEAVRSNPSHLIELDLTGNDPGPSGVKLIYDLIQDTNCKLKIVRFLKSRDAEAACVYLTDVLGVNPILLKELNLSDNKLRDLDGEKLSALLMDSHSKVEKITLNKCELTEKQCSAVVSILSCKTLVREMNLNNSRLLDSGLKHICEGLKNPQCHLHILNLSECSITEEGYRCLSEAVRSNPSHLIELDLTGNDPGPSGVKLIYDLIQHPKCALKTVRFLKSSSAVEAFEYLKTLDINPLLQREVNLKDHKLDESRVKQICDLLQDKHCQLNTLILRDCGLTEESCSSLASVLRSNSSVTELDMSNNNLLDSGVKKLQKGLEHTNCKLKKLRLSECSITEGGYVALSEAVRSNPSHLIELDLTGNDPGPSGVKLIYDLIQDTNCELNTVRLLKSSSAVEAFERLTKVLGINVLLQREINLKDHKLDESRVKQICDLLQDKHCKLNTLRLSGCSNTQKCIGDLISALSSNCSHLRDLDLSKNKLGTSGVNKLSETVVMQLMDLLKNSDCKLEKLRLRACGLADKGSGLFSALSSNPSHLRHLNLSQNKLGEMGAEVLCFLLRNLKLKLETLELRSCGFSKKRCADLSSALNSNPSHLRHLNLSKNKLGTLGVNKLSDLLKNPQFKLKTLQLCKCRIETKRMVILIQALCSNPSHLKELNLSQNEIKDDGVKHLCDLLKHCELEKLELCGCSLTEKQCGGLISALCLKPSHLRELNLSGNKLENLGVKLLCDLLKHSDCKLKRLELNNCDITDVSCLAETQEVRCLEVLDLSNNNLGNSEKKLREMLKDSKCELRLETQGWLAWGWSRMSGKSATQGDESPSSDEQSSEEEDEDNSSQKKTVREKKAAEPSQDPTDNAPDKDDDAEHATEDQTQDQANECSELQQ
ncbi:Ribonuclease inhibitor [Triplophysa tibetana]|uniref:Ribonuclease inhibitor n=1 Tax=Triplophysa tibetana TaxID=1572043 RepID=A0A5A9NQ05_9TELE|nr:Ribonuclease inhibitor [Triplophysa tibetana]